MGEYTVEDLRSAEAEMIRAQITRDQQRFEEWARHAQSIYEGLSDEARAEHAALTAV